MIRGVVEREIQAMVSKRDNIATHFPYQAWDPVPSLSSSSAGVVHMQSQMLSIGDGHLEITLLLFPIKNFVNLFVQGL